MSRNTSLKMLKEIEQNNKWLSETEFTET